MTPTEAYDIVKDYVSDDTKRPDLCDDVTSGVVLRRTKRAIMKYHRIDFWSKDFVEQIYGFQNDQQVQIINGLQFPRLRAIGYIRKWSDQLESEFGSSIMGAPEGGAFTEINPTRMLDGYGYNRLDTMYRSGSDIKLLSSTSMQKVLIGWFRDPLISDISQCDSWVLQDYQSLLAAEVSRRIFADIGKDEEAARKKEEITEELMRFQTNNLKLAVLE